MAQIQFSDSNAVTMNKPNDNKVGFFSLKNDGDEAVVRFMHDSVDTFDILTTHPINLGGKYRRVSCVRNPYEPMDKCPLCMNETKIETKIYIRLIEYTNENGTIVATPKVWERSLKYANTLKSYLDNYGPLSDMVCKVIRHGAPGEMTTDYEIIPNLSKSVFPDNVYVKHPEFFDDYKALGTIVLDKTAEEINEFVLTGQFPNKEQTTQTVTPQPAVAPAPQAAPQQVTYPNLTQPQPVQNEGVRFVDATPQQAMAGVERPVRYV